MNGDPKPAEKPNLLLAFVAVIAILYFGREFFLPLVLAVLISFLLAPLIRRLESWHMGRIFSVIVATVLGFSVIVGVGYIITGQLMDLANELPQYRENLIAKVAALRRTPDSPLDRATKTLRDVTKELSKPEADTTTQTSPPAATGDSSAGGAESEPATAPEARAAPAVPVEVVESADNPFEFLKAVVSPLLGPWGMLPS
jgi:hypothetical protein